MGQFRYIPPDEVAEKHRARNAAAPSRQHVRDPELKNVEVVLSLGDVRYIMYRTRPYCIPPVPFKLGQRVINTYSRMTHYAKETAMAGGEQSANAFYGEMMKLAKLLWKHVRPTGLVKQKLWRVGLMRNPFLSASEAELRAVTDFFLQGRMTSSVRSTSETGT